MPHYIEAADWRRPAEERVLLDVRTPAEFAGGHIPGAQNLPLFTDEERAEVGTLYKQTSPDDAFLRGLELAGPKLRWYVEEARRLAPAGKVILHCWRGGQRSGSMAWLLERAGFDVQILSGGYKAFRQYGRALIAGQEHPLVILGGYTGSGKTHILHALAEQGELVVDLEEIACHKGSSFGALGEEAQPSTEQFENNLFAIWDALPPNDQLIWLENESRMIGTVYLPDELWQQMKRVPLLHLEIPLEWRVANLVDDYALYPLADLRVAFERIRKRLGGQHVKAAVEALEDKDFAKAARIALQYYDKAYDLSVAQTQRPALYRWEVKENDPEKIAIELINWRKQMVFTSTISR